jgi:hypothetical protein
VPSPAQAVFGGAHHVAPRAVADACVNQIDAEFAQQHDVLAALTECLAEHDFGIAAGDAVAIRGVEKVDAEIQRPGDDRVRRLLIDGPAEVVAAEADAGHAQSAAADLSLLHGADSRCVVVLI